MTPVQVCNIALMEMGSRVQLTSLNDSSAQGVVAKTLYTPKTGMLLRAANWDFARAQLNLTLWKSAVATAQTVQVSTGSPFNSAFSNAFGGQQNTPVPLVSSPPPQPWLYSYLYPTDCLRARFVMPTIPVNPPGIPLTTAQSPLSYPPPVPTGIPFVPGTDLDQNNNPVRVILTNLPNAQLVYTRDLSQVPDTWDPLFLSGETALLGAYFINALARNKAQYDDAVAMSKSIIDQARAINGSESITNVDHTPDWMRARMGGGINWAWNAAGAPFGYGAYGGWDTVSYPCGLTY